VTVKWLFLLLKRGASRIVGAGVDTKNIGERDKENGDEVF
jgi:hypothetical protein